MEPMEMIRTRVCCKIRPSTRKLMALRKFIYRPSGKSFVRPHGPGVVPDEDENLFDQERILKRFHFHAFKYISDLIDVIVISRNHSDKEALRKNAAHARGNQ